MSRYRRSPITGLEPPAREQIDRELAKVERAFSYEAPGSFAAKADLDEHVQDTENPHATTHAQLPGLGDDDHPQYHNDARGDARYDSLGSAAGVQTNLDTHTGNSNIHTPLPATATLAEAAAGTEPALRSWSPALIGHAISNLSVDFDIDALPELGGAFADTDRMVVSRGGTEQRAVVTRIPEYVLLDPSWYGTAAEIAAGTITAGRTWTPAALKTAIGAEVIDDHTALSNIGANTHAQIDAHIASTSIHTPVPAVMPQAEAEAGTATTQRTISANVLNAAVQALTSNNTLRVAFDASPAYSTLVATSRDIFSTSLDVPSSGVILTFAQLIATMPSNGSAGTHRIRASLTVAGSLRFGDTICLGYKTSTHTHGGTQSADGSDGALEGDSMLIDALAVGAGGTYNTELSAYLETTGSATATNVAGRLLSVFLPGATVQ